MENRSTEMVFILDRSGSMGGLEDDTIGGYNTMLNKQKAVEGACRVTVASVVLLPKPNNPDSHTLSFCSLDPLCQNLMRNLLSPL